MQYIFSSFSQLEQAYETTVAQLNNLKEVIVATREREHKATSLVTELTTVSDVCNY